MTKLNQYIKNSNIKLKERDDFWFNNDNRRKKIYDLASKLMIERKISSEVALFQAQRFDQLFYDRYYNPTTRKEMNDGETS